MHALILFMVTVAQEQRFQQLRDQAQAVRLKQAGVKALVQEATAPRTCSIPLLNALKGAMPPNPMPVKKPQGNFFIREVTPPAPPCENWGK